MNFCGTLHCVVLLLLIIFHYDTVSRHDLDNRNVWECHKESGKCRGISQCLENGQPQCVVV